MPKHVPKAQGKTEAEPAGLKLEKSQSVDQLAANLPQLTNHPARGCQVAMVFGKIEVC
jgi:hypothetical protein